MAEQDCLVGVFDSVADAQDAAVRANQNGWREEHISLITHGRESNLSAIGPVRQGDRMERTATLGGVAGAVAGFLAGSSLFIIPGVGPVFFAGAMASGITGGLVGGLVGAMTGWGVKDAQIRDYEQQLREGKSLVVITGDPAALASAEEELRAAGAVQTTLHAETADSGHVDP